MERISKAIAKHSKLILLLAVILVVPAAFGYFKTDVNYDILSYLPEETSTMQAEKILQDEFGCGSIAMLIVEDMPDKDVAKVKEKVAKLDGVKKALWVDDFVDLSVPKEILPKDMTDLLYNGDKSTMIIVMLKEGTATLTTQNTVQKIRNIVGAQGFLSGMSGIIKDTKDCADGEMPLYIIIAGILTLIVLLLTMESTVVPFVFLLSISLAIIYNFGSNIILGEISYITKALAAVLQLGVTMDYSIFLLHRYDEELGKNSDRIEAMSNAIQNTFVSIIGSSTTTVAGFLALCTMDLSLGMDMGIVMAKGVIIGVLCTVTILPSLILIFDKPIHKYKHKTILPAFEKTSKFVVKHYKKLAVLFVIIFIPAFIGNNNAKVYYNLDESLPDDFPSIVATNKMKDDYHMESTDFILVSDKLDSNDVTSMIKELEEIDGVNSVIGLEKYIGPAIDQEMIPDEILSELKAGGYEEILLNSKYSDKEKKALYSTYIKNEQDTEYEIMNYANTDIDEYLKYKQQGFDSDYVDNGTVNGKAISGSKQRKVYEYINSAKMTYEQKLLLLGMQYKLTSGERSTLAKYVDTLNITSDEKLKIIKEHLNLLVKEKGEDVAIKEFRKHLAAYSKNLPNSSNFRVRVNAIDDKKELENAIDEYFAPFV